MLHVALGVIGADAVLQNGFDALGIGGADAAVDAQERV